MTNDSNFHWKFVTESYTTYFYVNDLDIALGDYSTGTLIYQNSHLWHQVQYIRGSRRQEYLLVGLFPEQATTVDRCQ